MVRLWTLSVDVECFSLVRGVKGGGIVVFSSSTLMLCFLLTNSMKKHGHVELTCILIKV